MPPVKWTPVDEALTTNNRNDMLGLLVADLWSDLVWPTKCLCLVYNLEEYKGDGMLEQE